MTVVFYRHFARVGEAFLRDDGMIAFRGLPAQFVHHLVARGIVASGRRLFVHDGPEFLKGLPIEFKNPYLHARVELVSQEDGR
jgi:hypothetical protein